MVVGVAIMGATAIMGAVSAGQAAGKARAAAYEQAANYNEQMLEEIRRKERQHKYAKGYMNAGLYSDGLMAGGSRKGHVKAQSMEMDREINWMHKHRKSAVRAIKKGAQIQYNAAQWQAGTQALAGLGNAYNSWQRQTATTPSPITTQQGSNTS